MDDAAPLAKRAKTTVRLHQSSVPSGWLVGASVVEAPPAPPLTGHREMRRECDGVSFNNIFACMRCGEYCAIDGWEKETRCVYCEARVFEKVDLGLGPPRVYRAV